MIESYRFIDIKTNHKYFFVFVLFFVGQMSTINTGKHKNLDGHPNVLGYNVVYLTSTGKQPENERNSDWSNVFFRSKSNPLE